MATDRPRPRKWFPSVSRIWLAAFGVFFALCATWSLATPLGGTADDTAHMTWAAAVVTGQLRPHETYTDVTDIGGVQAHYIMAQVRVPAFLDALNREAGCYAVHSGVTPACSAPLDGSGTEVASTTPMSGYNPLYYAVVGWPIRLVDALPALYAMRLVSALICAALLACAASIAWRVHRIAFAGVVVAATPMALYLGGSVNPNGPEAAGGLLAWTAFAALALDRRPEAVDRRVAYFVLGASVLALVRPAGVEWLVLLLCVAAVLMRRQTAAEILRSGRVRVALGVLLACAVLAEVWDHFFGGLNLQPSGAHSSFTVVQSLSLSYRDLPFYTQQMIGYFGWLDTPPPFGTVVAWLALVGLLVLGACAVGRWREILALAVLLAGAVVAPLAANAYQAVELGNLWQGRYLLWWVAGLPVLAAMTFHARFDALPARASRRLPVLVAVVAAAGQLGMWYQTYVRFGVGLGRRLLPLHTDWSPPGGWIISLLVIAAGLAGMIALSWPARASAEADNAAEADADTDADRSGLTVSAG